MVNQDFVKLKRKAFIELCAIAQIGDRECCQLGVGAEAGAAAEVGSALGQVEAPSATYLHGRGRDGYSEEGHAGGSSDHRHCRCTDIQELMDTRGPMDSPPTRCCNTLMWDTGELTTGG